MKNTLIKLKHELTHTLPIKPKKGNIIEVLYDFWGYTEEFEIRSNETVIGTKRGRMPVNVLKEQYVSKSTAITITK